MKKIVTAVIVVLLLVVGPWAIGRLAEKRINNGLDEVVKAAPYLGITDRKWTSGWFSSEQEVTFEVLGPWLRAMNPKTVMEELEKSDAPADEAPPETTLDESVAAGSPDAIAKSGDAPAPEAAPEVAAAPEPALPAVIKITVRNHIMHGPVLWTSGLGLARVDSKLVLDEAIRKELIEIFGTDEPVRISTRVGFFGGGTTTFAGDGHTVSVRGQPDALSYDDFKLKVGYSAHFDDVDAKGKWPRFEFKDASTGAQVLIKDVTLDAESTRVRGDLYDTDFKFEIAELSSVGEDKQVTEVADLHYVVDSTTNDDFMDIAAKLGTGPIKMKAIDDLGLAIKEVHYDFTVRRLHAETLEKMIAAIKASYKEPVATVADVDAALMAPMKEHALALLKHDPEFVLDRIGIVTAEGEGVLKGVIKLKGVTDQDVAAGAMGLINKIDADITVDIAQKLVEKFPNGGVSAGAAVDAGYAKREGDHLVSHIEFKLGELKINGKAQGIPGLGGPPASPPPQE